MESVLTFETVTFIIAISGVLFGVYHFFRNPADKNKAEIGEADKRICLLDQMLKDSSERNEMLVKTQTNHLHTLEVGVNRNNENIRKVSNDVIKLSTILDERLPKSK